jgi:hypothetical protein
MLIPSTASFFAAASISTGLWGSSTVVTSSSLISASVPPVPCAPCQCSRP